MEAPPSYQDCTDLLNFAEARLAQEGKITPQIKEALAAIHQMNAELEEETKGMTPEKKVFKFEMEYKERIDKAFEHLYDVSREAGIV
jgi:hypothetical protein